MTEHTFEGFQDGVMVFSATSSSRDRALTEAMHYAKVYRQDGPVLVKEKKPNGRGTEIQFSHTPPLKTA